MLENFTLLLVGIAFIVVIYYILYLYNAWLGHFTHTNSYVRLPSPIFSA